MQKTNAYIHLQSGNTFGLRAMEKAISDAKGQPYFFKAGGPDDDDIAEFGYANIYHGTPPEIDPETHKIVSDGHEEIGDKWFTKFKVEPLSAQELNNRVRSQIASIENQQTPRRLREAALGVQDSINFLSDLENQIAALRGQLQ